MRLTEAACSVRSKVINPISTRVGSTTRLKTKKAVPRWESCPTRARATNALETAPTKSEARPFASAVALARAVCKLRCSVVMIVTSWEESSTGNGLLCCSMGIFSFQGGTLPLICRKSDPSPSLSFIRLATCFELFLSFYLIHTEPSFQRKGPPSFSWLKAHLFAAEREG